MFIWLGRVLLIATSLLALFSIHFVTWNIARATFLRIKGQASQIVDKDVSQTAAWKLLSLSALFCFTTLFLDWNIARFAWNIHRGMSLTQAGAQPFGF